MNNVSHKKICHPDAVQIHVNPPPIPLSKGTNDAKSEKYCVKIELRRDPTSEKSDLYEFKMASFDNSEPEEFLLLVRNLQMTLGDSGSLAANAKIQYLRTLLRGESVHILDNVFVTVGSATTKKLNRNILGLGTYFFPINVVSEKKRAMRRRMRKLLELKVRR